MLIRPKIAMNPARLADRTRRRGRGFTLIELMIAVAIVAILGTLAYPSYRDYVLRGRITDGTNGLIAMQADLERHFQDNRQYTDVGAFASPCSRAAAARTFGNFVVSCSVLTATTYTLLATGNGPVNNFSFTINQARVQATGTTVTGWTSAGACWVVRRGQACT